MSFELLRLDLHISIGQRSSVKGTFNVRLNDTLMIIQI